MSEIVYEMPDEYNKNMAILLEFIEARERYRKELAVIPPWVNGNEVRDALAQLDKSIDSIEKQLAEEYEAFQREKSQETEMSGIIERGWEAANKIYLGIKHETPHLLEKFVKQCIDPMPEELQNKFYDDVAVMEATRLDEVLGYNTK
jgi:hypothetical protein